MNQQQETKTCKYCGSEIPKNAKICPNCRKKQSHKVRNTILIIIGVLLVLVVIGAMFGGGGNNSTTVVETETETSNDNNSSTATAPTEQNFTVGSTYSVDNIDVTLDSANISTGDEFNTPAEGMEYLILNWTIVNNSDEEFNTFDISFNAYVDGTKTEMAITGIGGGLNAADILPAGTNVSGNRIYEVPVNWQECQVRVQNGLVGGDSVTFTITPDQVS